MLKRIVAALLLGAFACLAVAQGESRVDCRKQPDHPRCAPRA
jgi:hypothetical protein